MSLITRIFEFIDVIVSDIALRTSVFVAAGEDLVALDPMEFAKSWTGSVSHSGNLALQKVAQTDIGCYVVDPNTGAKIGLILTEGADDSEIRSTTLGYSNHLHPDFGVSDASTAELILKENATVGSIGKVVRIYDGDGQGLEDGATLYAIVNGDKTAFSINTDSIEVPNMGDTFGGESTGKYVAMWDETGKSSRGGQPVEQLNTTSKDIVGAINEAYAQGGSGGFLLSKHPLNTINLRTLEPYDVAAGWVTDTHWIQGQYLGGEVLDIENNWIIITEFELESPPTIN